MEVFIPTPDTVEEAEANPAAYFQKLQLLERLSARVATALQQQAFLLPFGRFSLLPIELIHVIADHQFFDNPNQLPSLFATCRAAVVQRESWCKHMYHHLGGRLQKITDYSFLMRSLLREIKTERWTWTPILPCEKMWYLGIPDFNDNLRSVYPNLELEKIHKQLDKCTFDLYQEEPEMWEVLLKSPLFKPEFFVDYFFLNAGTGRVPDQLFNDLSDLFQKAYANNLEICIPWRLSWKSGFDKALPMFCSHVYGGFAIRTSTMLVNFCDALHSICVISTHRLNFFFQQCCAGNLDEFTFCNLNQKYRSGNLAKCLFKLGIREIMLLPYDKLVQVPFFYVDKKTSSNFLHLPNAHLIQDWCPTTLACHQPPHTKNFVQIVCMCAAAFKHGDDKESKKFPARFFPPIWERRNQHWNDEDSLNFIDLFDWSSLTAQETAGVPERLQRNGAGMKVRRLVLRRCSFF